MSDRPTFCPACPSHEPPVRHAHGWACLSCGHRWGEPARRVSCHMSPAGCVVWVGLVLLVVWGAAAVVTIVSEALR